MKGLECKDYVKLEATPIVTDIINDWIDAERYENWFENIEDVEDFSEMELPDVIFEKAVAEISISLEDCIGDYAYDSTECTEDELHVFVETLWEKIKREYCERLTQLFDGPSFDDYLDEDDEEDDYGYTTDYDF